jgi:CheY-like chemotaxis protein
MNVLMVDDEPLRASKLIAMGHNVYLAHGLDQIQFYLSKSNSYYFDIATLDHDMPQGDGQTVCKVIRSDLVLKSLKVCIHSTNEVGSKVMGHILEDYSIEYLRKNFLDDDFETALIDYAMGGT